MRSQLVSNGNGSSESCPPVLIVDSTGEMLALYSRAGIVFVGKSVCGKGGQNFIEAAPSSAAIVAGPQMQNFLVPLRDFRSAQAIAQVGPGDMETVIHELRDKLRSLIANVDERVELGRRAKRLFDTKRDSARPTAEMIFESLQNGARLRKSA
jgi:3-deoxy-D-manno-octulosonic-acid transferase